MASATFEVTGWGITTCVITATSVELADCGETPLGTDPDPELEPDPEPAVVVAVAVAGEAGSVRVTVVGLGPHTVHTVTVVVHPAGGAVVAVAVAAPGQ